MVRVPLEEEDCLSMGLDVRAWLADGSVDFVVGQDAAMLVDTSLQRPWLPDAAAAASNGAAAYYRPPRRVYDHRVGSPSLDMYRAMVSTLRRQGYAGVYDGYLSWPFSGREKGILREAGFPEAHTHAPKRFLMQPAEADGKTKGRNRQLPGN